MKFRCQNSDGVGCHSVILAARSPLLRVALEDSLRGGGTAEILMLEYSREQVENLLSLLYTGRAETTPSMEGLLDMFTIDVAVASDLVKEHFQLTKVTQAFWNKDGLKPLDVVSHIDSDEEGKLRSKETLMTVKGK